MARQSHGTGTPSRMNEVLGRDALGFIARQTVQTQDFREAVYAYPDGKQGHWVRNTHSETLYWVGDLTGGSTFEPGSIVFVASRSGKRGEKIIGRSPAGMVAASMATVTAPPSVGPGAVEPPAVPATYVRTSYVDLCYNRDSNVAYIAAFESTESPDPPAWRIAFIRVNGSDIPHSSPSVETIIGSIAVGSGEYVATMGMFYLGSGSFVFAFVSDNDPLLEGDRRVRMVKVNNSGTVLADTSYPITGGYDGVSLTFTDMSFAVVSGALYSIESVKVTAINPSPPPQYNNRRLVKRSLSTLAEIADEAFPDPVVTGLSFTAVRFLTPLFAYSQRFDGADVPVISQGYDSTPSLSGTINVSSASATFTPPNNTDAYIPGVGILQLGASKLLLWDGDVTNDSGFTAIYDGTSFDTGLFRFDDMTDDSVVLLGDGTTWITSIISAAGQQLP